MLTPDAIKIVCEGGSIWIEDGVGISIVSNYDLNISTKENINITSLFENTTVIGTEKVNVEQSTAAIVLEDGKVFFKGAEVHTD